MIRAAALLHDLDAARRRKERKDAQRGVSAGALADGQAYLCLTGPTEQVAAMHTAIEDAARLLGGDPGGVRTREQREFDAAYELLTRSGPDHAGPDGAIVHLEAQVVVPVDTADSDGDGEQLGELPGLGPILPSTCRQLLARADTLRRICVDARTGQVLAVDDPVPGPAQHAADGHDPATVQQLLAETLAAMRTTPVALPDLSTPAYRPTAKAVRFVETRDRTCRFPGCTRPATRSDLDHRLPWPLGPTDPANLQALCRHHHRAKQSNLFTVTTEPDGSTLWTLTRTGQTFRSPPPTLTHTW
jgi:hypothetical protein